VTRKSDQLASSIERALREVISRGFHDPRIAGLITVTGVKVAPDLRNATANISVLPEEKAELTMHGLTAAAPFIRREIGEMIQTRAMPQLDFRLDTTLKKQARVLEALDKVREEISAADAKAQQQAPPPESAG
jgi:ribosome-binding factor A